MKYENLFYSFNKIEVHQFLLGKPIPEEALEKRPENLDNVVCEK